MFDTTSIKLGDVTNEIKFNTPSTGMMQRSHPKSKFLRFQKGSDYEKLIFTKDGSDPVIERVYYSKREFNEYSGKWTGGDYCKEKISIEILQILIFGDNYYLIEYVKIEDLKEE